MGASHDVWELWRNYWPVLVGNAMEWYEFAVYGYLEIYMERNFFRGSALATWLGFTATFAARPLGGMFLGLLSDTFGRKLAVVITGSGMLLATVGQGLLPTPRAWGEDSMTGRLGLYLLFALRLLQGLCAGGEMGAVSTYIVEVASERSMGRCVALIGISGNMGFLLARAAIWTSESILNEEEMLQGGWRWPFLNSFIPGFISSSGRLCCLKESKVFEAEQLKALVDGTDEQDLVPHKLRERRSTGKHIREFAWTHVLEIVIGIGGVISAAVFNYGGCVWGNSFLKKHGASRDFLMLAGICSRFLQMLLALPMGYLTDIYGCAFMNFAGAFVQTCAGFPMFMALRAAPTSLANLFVTYTCCFAWIASFNATICMYCAELFPTSVRNLGVGFSFNVGVGLFGGFAPLMAEASLQWSPYGPGILFSSAGATSCIVMLLSIKWQRSGTIHQLAHIRPRPYFGTWADGENSDLAYVVADGDDLTRTSSSSSGSYTDSLESD